MTLNQLQTFIVGVLQGWVPNKAVLDKFTETEDGKLLFNGVEVGSGSFVTDAEVQQAIADTLNKLGLTDADLEEITANVGTFAALQTAIANGANKITVTKPLTITHPIETWKKMTFTNYKIKELTTKIVENGKLIYKFPKVKEIAKFAKSEIESFWDEYTRLDRPHIYKVDLSDKLLNLKTEMLSTIRK